MRKITEQATNRFMNPASYGITPTRGWKSGNTQVTVTCENNVYTAHLYLHGNEIARRDHTKMEINHQGYQTNTTKERLNGLPSVSIHQKDFVWYLNNEVMPEGWVKV